MSAQSDLWTFALADLSPAERDVYQLSQEGKDTSTIAARTDRAPSTVRTLLHRARRKRGESPRV